MNQFWGQQTTLEKNMKEMHLRTMAGCPQYAKSKMSDYKAVEDNPNFKVIYVHRKSLDGGNSKYLWEIRRVMLFVERRNVSMFLCLLFFL